MTPIERAEQLLVCRGWSELAYKDAIRKHIREAVEAEREACAVTAESMCEVWKTEGDGESLHASGVLYGMADGASAAASAIRERKTP